MPHYIPENYYLWVGEFSSIEHGSGRISGKLELIFPVEFVDENRSYIGYINFKGSYMRDCRYIVHSHISDDKSSIVIEIQKDKKVIVLNINKRNLDSIKMVGTYKSENPTDSGIFDLGLTLLREFSSSEVIKL